ncbi:unnamed protein product [Protopolystoma xenopodis]|uniref:Uncharacterized protein n=1 Tax=Protopolystoma xenopodis TaxID=117903 RepID=A0A3S5A3E4_9PLAT|nr:unnamed protein product [Protopolystoma xenopodis]
MPRVELSAVAVGGLAEAKGRDDGTGEQTSRREEGLEPRRGREAEFVVATTDAHHFGPVLCALSSCPASRCCLRETAPANLRWLRGRTKAVRIGC